MKRRIQDETAGFSLLVTHGLLLALACGALLGACKDHPAPPASVEAGVFRFGPAAPKSPQRIVSLAPNMTEILFALGVGDRVVGVTRFCDYPAAAKALPKIGGFLDVSVEAVAAQRPDLVIGVPNATIKGAVESLGKLGIPVFLAEAHRLGEVYTLINEVGAVVDRVAAARLLTMSMRMRATELRGSVSGYKPVPTLFAYGRDPLIVAGPGSFAGELLDLAGGINVVKEDGPRYRSYSMERVLVLAPEVIIDSAMGAEDRASNEEALRARWGRFASLPAVKNGRLHWVDPQIFARPGPRLVDALAALAKLLHPKAMASAPRAVPPELRAAVLDAGLLDKLRAALRDGGLRRGAPRGPGAPGRPDRGGHGPGGVDTGLPANPAKSETAVMPVNAKSADGGSPTGAAAEK